MSENKSLKIINEKPNEVNEFNYQVENIKDLIYTIRGKQVMLDSDVAMLYQYTTKNINKAMKRNISRFPEDFCFQLTEEEVENLRFQFGTSSLNKENYGGRRYLPYVYTEQGISMLAGVLKNEIAIQVSINIIRAFIEMRKFITNNAQVLDINKFNNQYPVLKVAKTNKFHDRFIVIDNKELYHVGASLKDLGKRCFAISKIEDVEYIEKISNYS